jgi:SAM-dependent methyltransferase
VTRGFGYQRGQPIDRYYIERFLARHANEVLGHVLEVGDATYTLRYGGLKILRSDVLHVRGGPGATLIGDLTSLDRVAANTFDCVICTQTLQLIYDVRNAVATIHRILKPGGIALVTVPGATQTDDAGWSECWYWCFTEHSMRRMFRDVFGNGSVEVRSHGNALTAVAFLQGIAAEDLHWDELEFADSGYQVLVTVAATKRA